MNDDLRARLAKEIHEVDWKPLAPHAKRGGLILVDRQLNLLEVAVAIAADDSDKVRRWMDARWLSRATDAQIATWQAETEELFAAVIVQPYVLAQRNV